MNIKRFSTIVAFLVALAAQAQVSFTGNNKEVFDEIPAKSTGLNHIYVLYDTNGVGMTYTASTGETVTWAEFGAQGAAYEQEITNIQRSGRETTLSQVTPGKGYHIKEGLERETYVWVINYADYYLRLINVIPDEKSDCGSTTINIQGKGDAIPYYTINGVHKTLSRELKLNFNTLRWDDDEVQWLKVDTTETFEYVKPTTVIVAPLCNTQFTLSGDRFLNFWNEGVELVSDTYNTTSIDVQTTATQEKKEGHDNEKGNDQEGVLGGSAPVTITFKAYCTEAVSHLEWQEASDADFNNIILRLDDEEVTQTFNEAGTFYWRFYATNADASCEAVSETYTVNIGESELVCPNVFSPGSTEGANDIWKVSYKSITEFHCSIFNIWGVEMISFNDPSQGWDGKYKGKLVSPGTYYYVIQAVGADGQKYKLSGDINIIRYKRHNSTGGSTVTE